MAENGHQDQRIHELAKAVAVRRADMKTLPSDFQGTLERFRADAADWKVDMGQREFEARKREKRLLLLA